MIQRDDGALANQSVGRDQLAAEITVGFNVPSTWLTSTAYVASDTVFKDNVFYVCEESHTSGAFATDLAAGKWEEIADFNVLSQAASLITYSNAISGLAAENAQDAIDELASEKLDKSGGTMSGAIGMGSNKITSLGNATADGDALNRITADGRFQPLDADLTAKRLAVSHGKLHAACPGSHDMTCQRCAVSYRSPACASVSWYGDNFFASSEEVRSFLSPCPRST